MLQIRNQLKKKLFLHKLARKFLEVREVQKGLQFLFFVPQQSTLAIIKVIIIPLKKNHSSRMPGITVAFCLQKQLGSELFLPRHPDKPARGRMDLQLYPKFTS